MGFCFWHLHLIFKSKFHRCVVSGNEGFMKSPKSEGACPPHVLKHWVMHFYPKKIACGGLILGWHCRHIYVYIYILADPVCSAAQKIHNALLIDRFQTMSWFIFSLFFFSFFIFRFSCFVFMSHFSFVVFIFKFSFSFFVFYFSFSVLNF